MWEAIALAADLGVLTVGYWLSDRAIRGGGLLGALGRIRLLHDGPTALVFMATYAALSPLWSWEHVPEGETLRWVAAVLGVALAWRASTRDIDVVRGNRQTLVRLLVLASAVLTWLSPGMLVSTCLLLTTPFGMWQHHATLPMRVLQALLAFVVLQPLVSGLGALRDASALFLFLVTIQVSHYVVTALAKGHLGPRWYSWPLDNRLHHIAASAYSWGWARFVPWARWRRVVAVVRALEVPLQVVVFLLEALSPLALLHAHASVGFSIAFAGFHLGVFLLSGLLFWEWIVTDLVLAMAVWQLSAGAAAVAFGPGALLLGVVLMVAFPLRHRLWRPMPLGWWDTPFTQRMHWRVRGRSGAMYGLYADFMDPHERIYGKVHGYFLAPVPVLTYHLGEAFRHELRDGLRAAGGDPERLDALREQFGIEPRDARLLENHETYLQRFCWELNRGARKHVLPSRLRFLKAPGGQCYYWGDLPAYRRQEPIEELEVVYREEYFDGEALQRLRDEVVLRVPIERSSTPPRAAREPTPKELDDHLLSFAAGRLIRLPGLGGGLVHGDDGDPSSRAGAAAGPVAPPDEG